MAVKFVDLSGDQPKEIEVFTLRNIAYKLNTGNSGVYYTESLLKEWLDDPSIETPKPVYTLSDESYWKVEQVKEWQTVFDREIEREEERKAQRLAAETVTKAEIAEAIVELARRTERNNRYTYSHNRGNSLADGRKRALMLEGQIDFARQLLGDASMPKEQQQELRDLLNQAKTHVASTKR